MVSLIISPHSKYVSEDINAMWVLHAFFRGISGLLLLGWIDALHPHHLLPCSPLATRSRFRLCLIAIAGPLAIVEGRYLTLRCILPPPPSGVALLQQPCESDPRLDGFSRDLLTAGSRRQARQWQ